MTLRIFVAAGALAAAAIVATGCGGGGSSSRGGPIAADGSSSTDYSASEDDNVTVQGVAGSHGGLGYFGFSYDDEHQDTLPALEVDGGSGCIAPSVDTARSGNYAPLSRPLYVYVKRSSLEHAEVADFVRYMLDNEAAIAERARFVPLDDSQLADTKQKLEGVLA